jgi:hypothetical protein
MFRTYVLGKMKPTFLYPVLFALKQLQFLKRPNIGAKSNSAVPKMEAVGSAETLSFNCQLSQP